MVGVVVAATAAFLLATLAAASTHKMEFQVSGGRPDNSTLRRFEVDYEGGRFLLDGKTFRYVSGSIHYFRVPRSKWRDRLTKIRAAGLNAIQTYIEWSQHEPSPGNYNFTGQLDFEYFIRLAQKLKLFVILRPGPYICAERDLGGYPPWLFTRHPDMMLRTSDPNHMRYVKKWMDVLMPRIKPLLYGNGGPVIMVQVENEYGSYFACDVVYTSWLRDLYKSYVGESEAVLFTTDGAADGYLRCGKIPGVFITVDFGAGADVVGAFATIGRAGQTGGPLVNSELYAGWLTRWNEPYQTVDTDKLITSMQQILSLNNTSINIYMFHGGTNFAFTSGANCAAGGGNLTGYVPQLTSYDYDAPITESGDLTPKYYAIKRLLNQYVEVPTEQWDFDAERGKFSLGPIRLDRTISLWDMEAAVTRSNHPMTFEQLGLSYGYVLYSHTLSPANASTPLADPSHLYVPGLRDRAIVILDSKPVGVLSRFRNILTMPVNARLGQTLSLFVENEGRINFGTYINDTKGIVCNVLLNGKPLYGWEMRKYPLDQTNVATAEKQAGPVRQWSDLPSFYTGEFTLPHESADTFLLLQNWSKGVAFVNGFNLGRYWVTTGPQSTLYVPGDLIMPPPSTNRITLFEVERPDPRREVRFVSQPVLNLPVPQLGRYGSQCQLKCSIS